MLPSRLSDRIRLPWWAVPLSLALLVAVYQLGPTRWIQATFGNAVHFAAEVLLYSTLGPLLAFLALTLIGGWLDERDRLERQARASERRLASITAASADAILSLDPEGRVESWNRSAELLLGYSAEEIRGRTLASLFGGGEAAGVESRWLAEAVYREGFMRGHETVCRAADGREVVVELTATRLDDDAGQPRGEHGEPPPGMSVILRDVTSRKRREEEIRRLNASLNQQVAERTRELAEKLEELARANAELQRLDQMRSEFVSLVSHQIRAPLTNMRGAVERMQATCGAATPTCARMLEVLEGQVGRLDRLVRDVLSASRLEAGEMVLHPEPISLLPVVEQVVEQMRARTAPYRGSSTGRPFRLPLKPGLPLALADRDRVAEVLANLLDNADKYSPPGTEVVIEAQADEASVTLSVRDAGPGLPPGAAERVFDKFYRVDSSDAQAAYGYGLGLYVCRRLVEAMGGRIGAENVPGGGARFSFTLPVAR